MLGLFFLTIRQITRRRFIRGYVGSLVGICLLPTFLIIADDRLPVYWLMTGALFVLLAVLLPVTYLQLWIRCPKCKGNLGIVAHTLIKRSGKRQANFCPFCSVSLDSES
jgi:hypothetical protein